MGVYSKSVKVNVHINPDGTCWNGAVIGKDRDAYLYSFQLVRLAISGAETARCWVVPGGCIERERKRRQQHHEL